MRRSAQPSPPNAEGWCWYDVTPARWGWHVLAGDGIRPMLHAWRPTLVGAHLVGQRFVARLERARDVRETRTG